MKRNRLWALLALIILALAGYAAWRLTLHDPLPSPTDVERISVQFYHKDQQRDVDVAIPDEALPWVWDKLQPASTVSKAPDTPIWGQMQFTTKDRRNWTVVLFEVDGSVVYEVGVGIEPRAYYRGGRLSDLEKLFIDLSKNR